MLESIKKLRESTGAGMMDVKKALTDANGNEDQAIALLRERGILKAGKKADREAREGLVAFVLSDDKKRAAIVEVNSETDFVARNADFQAMVAWIFKLKSKINCNYKYYNNCKKSILLITIKIINK